MKNKNSRLVGTRKNLESFFYYYQGKQILFQNEWSMNPFYGKNKMIYPNSYF